MEINRQIFTNAISSHAKLVEQFKKTGFPGIQKIVNYISSCFEDNGKVLLIGNGGSAADCQHIAGELVGRFKSDREPLPAISLATDTSVLTCIGNDYDYKSVFSRQIGALAAKQDVLWALSTSGSSTNIIKSARTAKEKEMPIISFTGRKESPLEQLSDICICAGTRETAHAQQIHQMSYHIICSYIDKICETQ